MPDGVNSDARRASPVITHPRGRMREYFTRRYVAEKYADVIDAFYAGRDQVELTTSITYEDGRTATMQSRVRIEDVASPAGAGVPA